MKREIERFAAVTNDGRPTTIIILQDDTSATQADGAPAPGPPPREVWTIEGDRCTRLDNDFFEIIDDPAREGIFLHRVQPASTPREVPRAERASEGMLAPPEGPG